MKNGRYFKVHNKYVFGDRWILPPGLQGNFLQIIKQNSPDKSHGDKIGQSFESDNDYPGCLGPTRVSSFAEYIFMHSKFEPCKHDSLRQGPECTWCLEEPNKPLTQHHRSKHGGSQKYTAGKTYSKIFDFDILLKRL